jgi:hypothetical protein
MVIDQSTAYIMTSNFTNAALGTGSYTKNREYDIVDTNAQDVQAVDAIFQADWNHTTASFNDANLVVSPVNARSDFTTLIGQEVREYRALEPMFVSSLQGQFWTTNRGGNSLRLEAAPLGVGSLWIMYQKLKPMSLWCYPCGSWLREKLPFEASLEPMGETADTPMQRVGVTAGIPVTRCSCNPSGVKGEPTSRYKIRTRESRNTSAPLPVREAKR